MPLLIQCILMGKVYASLRNYWEVNSEQKRVIWKVVKGGDEAGSLACLEDNEKNGRDSQKNYFAEHLLHADRNIW